MEKRKRACLLSAMILALALVMGACGEGLLEPPPAEMPVTEQTVFEAVDPDSLVEEEVEEAPEEEPEEVLPEEPQVPAAEVQEGNTVAPVTETPAVSLPDTELPVNESGETVYITDTGEKYHLDGCKYLWDSQIAISLEDAQAQGYTACGTCHTVVSRT